MAIYVMVHRDEAGSGGEETRMKRGLISDKMDNGKLGFLR
jgi:hypothetical protein